MPLKDILKEEFDKSILTREELTISNVKELTNSPNITDNYAQNLLNELKRSEERIEKNTTIDNIKTKLTKTEWDFILKNRNYIYEREKIVE